MGISAQPTSLPTLSSRMVAFAPRGAHAIGKELDLGAFGIQDTSHQDVWDFIHLHNPPFIRNS